MEKRNGNYKFAKIAAGVLFIPLILFSAPIGGYFAGSFLAGRFNIGFFIPEIGAALGFASAVFETVRIIRIVRKMSDKKG